MEQATSTRERILQSAVELFHLHGYNAVGVKEICEHAGVKKGSFYHFFPAKRDLALEYLDRQWAFLERYVMQPAFAEEMSSVERIQRIFQVSCDYQGRLKDNTGYVCGCPVGNLALELSTHDAVIREKLQAVFREMSLYFQRALDEGVAAGELGDMDTEATAQTILAYYEGCMLLAKTYDAPDLIVQLVASAIHLASRIPREAGQT